MARLGAALLEGTLGALLLGGLLGRVGRHALLLGDLEVVGGAGTDSSTRVSGPCVWTASESPRCRQPAARGCRGHLFVLCVRSSGCPCAWEASLLTKSLNALGLSRSGGTASPPAAAPRPRLASPCSPDGRGASRRPAACESHGFIRRPRLSLCSPRHEEPEVRLPRSLLPRRLSFFEHSGSASPPVTVLLARRRTRWRLSLR